MDEKYTENSWDTCFRLIQMIHATTNYSMDGGLSNSTIEMRTEQSGEPKPPIWPIVTSKSIPAASVTADVLSHSNASTSLTTPLTLTANPEAYDYIHSFSLLASNAIEMIAGDGQKIVVQGQRKLSNWQQQNAIKLRVYDVNLVDLYDDGDLLPTIKTSNAKHH